MIPLGNRPRGKPPGGHQRACPIWVPEGGPRGKMCRAVSGYAAIASDRVGRSGSNPVDPILRGRPGKQIHTCRSHHRAYGKLPPAAAMVRALSDGRWRRRSRLIAKERARGSRSRKCKPAFSFKNAIAIWRSKYQLPSASVSACAPWDAGIYWSIWRRPYRYMYRRSGGICGPRYCKAPSLRDLPYRAAQRKIELVINLKTAKGNRHRRLAFVSGNSVPTR